MWEGLKACPSPHRTPGVIVFPFNQNHTVLFLRPPNMVGAFLLPQGEVKSLRPLPRVTVPGSRVRKRESIKGNSPPKKSSDNFPKTLNEMTAFSGYGERRFTTKGRRKINIFFKTTLTKAPVFLGIAKGGLKLLAALNSRQWTRWRSMEVFTKSPLRAVFTKKPL